MENQRRCDALLRKKTEKIVTNAEIIDQFELDYPNYNFDPKKCIKLKPSDFNLINRNDLDRYSSNAWNTFLSESMIKPVKKELQKYIKNKPWLNKEKVNI